MSRRDDVLAFLAEQRRTGTFNVFTSVLDLEARFGISRQAAIRYRNEFIESERRPRPDGRKHYWRET